MIVYCPRCRARFQVPKNRLPADLQHIVHEAVEPSIVPKRQRGLENLLAEALQCREAGPRPSRWTNPRHFPIAGVCEDTTA